MVVSKDIKKDGQVQLENQQLLVNGLDCNQKEPLAHCWILEEKMDIVLGLYFVSPDGRGGHPLTVCQNTKDHSCSIQNGSIMTQSHDQF